MFDNFLPCFLSLILWALSFEVFLEEPVDCLDDSEVSEKISGDDDEDDELSEKSGSEGIFIVSVKRDVSSWKIRESLFCDRSSFLTTSGLSVTLLDLTDDVPDGRVGGQSCLYAWFHCECCGKNYLLVNYLVQ